MILRPYQEVGRDFLASRRHALLADEMRVGKTPQAILAAHKVQAERIIVVCPAIGVAHWKAEFLKWWPGVVQPELSVLSYDRAKLSKEKLITKTWDLVIVDECHHAKNPEAERTRLIYGKAGLGWASRRLWALSGTPATKHAGELWPMLRAFGSTALDYDQFLARYCHVVQRPHGRSVTGTKKRMIPEIREMIGKVMLRRTRREVAPEIPPIGFEFLEVTPAFAHDLSVPAGQMTEAALTAWVDAHPNADREDRRAVAQSKVQPLADEILFSLESGLYQQTVVFGWHIDPLASLHKRLTERGVRADVLSGATPQARRVAIQADLTRGATQVVIANIAAAGTSIDLSAARHGYFLELDWLPANNAQAANRLVNMAKSDPVTFDVLTTPGSVDEKIQRILLRRSSELAKMI